MVRSKKVLVFLSAVVFCFSLLTGALVTETKASTCYILYHTWDFCGDHYTTWDYTYLLVHIDGSFDDLAGGWGYWGWYGSSLFLQYTDTLPGSCDTFYSGTKKQGNRQCTDGSYPGSEYAPGCWYLKKSKGCLVFDAENTGGGQGSLTTSGSIGPAK